MFETTAIESRIQKPSENRRLTFPIAVLLHVFAIGAIVLAAVWTFELPASPPDQTASFFWDQGPPIDEGLLIPEDTVTTNEPPNNEPEKAPDASETVIEVDAPVIVPSDVPETLPVVPANVLERFGPPADQSDSVGRADGPVGTGGSGPANANQIYTPGSYGVTKPQIVFSVEPVYPQTAIRIRLEGSVVVQCTVDRDGRPSDLEVVSATSSMFREPALAALRQYRFRPGQINGQPVNTRFLLTVRFSLER